MKHLKPEHIFVADQLSPKEALSRTSHLAIGAHADDLEIFAFHGIQACYKQTDKWFTGITLTDGAGSPRTGLYENISDEEMVKIRHQEQIDAARIGDYSCQIQLGLKSSEVKSNKALDLASDLQNYLTEILLIAQPEVIYTHNIADKHDTHVAVAMQVIRAVKNLYSQLNLRAFYGCEVWRDLDWMSETERVSLAVSGDEDLALRLCAAHKSQIEGGKRYDLAAIARRKANATFFASKHTDLEESVIFAMDYMPLLTQNLTAKELVARHIDDFKNDVISKIDGYSI